MTVSRHQTRDADEARNDMCGKHLAVFGPNERSCEILEIIFTQIYYGAALLTFSDDPKRADQYKPMAKTSRA